MRRKLLALLASLATAAQAGTFDSELARQPVVGSANGIVSRIDVESVKIRKGELTAWVFSERRVPEQGIVYSSRELTAVRCEDEQSAFVLVQAFDKRFSRGTMVADIPVESLDWRTQAPGTVGAAVIKVICKLYAGKTPAESGLQPVQRSKQTISEVIGVDLDYFDPDAS